jgi:hypothetical protein
MLHRGKGIEERNWELRIWNWVGGSILNGREGIEERNWELGIWNWVGGSFLNSI